MAVCSDRMVYLQICCFHSDAIVIYRAPQFKNKFESATVVFSGSNLDQLTTFIKENL